MKVSILYHSVTGNTEKMAEYISEGIRNVENTEVRIMSIEDFEKQFVNESDVVLLGCPTYAASVSWQMKKFLDSFSVSLNGKLGGVFSTAAYAGGGSSVGELVMISAMLVRGMLIYSGGCVNGDPYIHLGAVAIQDGDDWQRERARIFGKRVVLKAQEIFPGK